MARLCSPREVWKEERGLLASQGDKPSVFPAGPLKPQLSYLSVYPHDYGTGKRLNLSFLSQSVVHWVTSLRGYSCRPIMTPFWRNALYSHRSLFFQWPTLRTLTTHRRSLSFTAINVGSHARVKYFGSRPNISTSNVSPAKVWCLQLPALKACHSLCSPQGPSLPLNPVPGSQVIRECSEALASLPFPSLLGFDSRGRPSSPKTNGT